ncbi:MAG: energy transducer TonB [Sphingobium sp.]
MFKNIAGKALVAAAVATVAVSPAFAQPAAWQQAVARQIASKQTYPRAAQMRGDEGTVKVKVFVGADGSVQKTEMVTPSGSSVLDREALALPAKVGNLPAPPGGATAIVLPLTYKLM